MAGTLTTVALVSIIPLAIFLQLWLVPIIKLSGLLYSPQSINNGQCQRITELQGCEDAYVLPGANLAYFACSPPISRAHWFPPITALSSLSHPPSVLEDGTLSILDLSSHAVTRLSLQLSPSLTSPRLATHGIDGILSPSGELLTLFAINHRLPVPLESARTQGADSVVEVFETRPGSGEARHVRTVRHELIRTPNSVLAVKEGKGIYVSNDHPYKADWLRLVDFFIWPKASEIVYCDLSDPVQVDCKVAVDGLKYPNGLAKGPGNTIYNVGTFKTDLRVLTAQADDTLVLTDEIKLGKPLDNIFVLPSGSLILPLLASPIQWQTHATKSDLLKRGEGGHGIDMKRATSPPVEVVRVGNETGEAKFYGHKYRTELIFADPGTNALGSTSAFVNKRTLYLTGPFSPWVSACKLDASVNLD